jgi:hypothetical protein
MKSKNSGDTMFQSAITCQEYENFLKVCKKSEEEAIKIMIRYTNTDQDFLRGVIDAIWHDGKLPDMPFMTSECELQQKIRDGSYHDVFDEGHHKLGHF